MRLPAFLLVLMTATLTACQSASPMKTASDQGWSHYGVADGDAADTKSIAIGALDGGETDVVVEGTIADVCAIKGCWMNVTDGEKEVFVKFKDYSFFVPRNAAGHNVVIRGTATSEVVSVEELRHYAHDAGKSAEEIEAITEPQTKITFMADSVYVDGDGLDAPWTADDS